METPEVINLDDIIFGDRARTDYGDIHSMIASIKEFGLIQPLVLADNLDGKYLLIAGGRRLTALKQMKYSEGLWHGKDWILRDERTDTDEGQLRIKSIELEENLKRKDMTWPEQVAAKAKLMEIMQRIHGKATQSGLTREEKRNSAAQGFGVRKLAAMLGESPATVSQDLHLAKMVELAPQLKNTSSKAVAHTQSIGVLIATAVKAGLVNKTQAAAATAQAQPTTVKPLEYRVMVFCKDEEDQANVMSEMMSKGYKCQAVII